MANLFWRQAFLPEGTREFFFKHNPQQQQKKMTEPAEQTSILVPTEDLGAVLESFKLPILQKICLSENLDAAGGRRELTARIRKRTEEAQPKYQRQKKVLKLAHKLAAEVGPVSYVQSRNLDEILLGLTIHLNRSAASSRVGLPRKWQVLEGNLRHTSTSESKDLKRSLKHTPKHNTNGWMNYSTTFRSCGNLKVIFFFC